MKHDLLSPCEKCRSFFLKYPNFHAGLREWFFSIQKKHPEAHISCAGRGQAAQEELYNDHRSRAHWKESSHNFNAAVDVFELKYNQVRYDREWFDLVIGANLTPEFKWYGAPGSKFYELPHIEVAAWKDLVAAGKLKLVE